MIDLDHGSRATAEERLMLAVVLLAISDACTRPNARSPAGVALDAQDFIWSDRLDSFLNWLNMDPGWFRWRLTNVMENRSTGFVNHFTPEQRRAFRHNRRMYAKLGAPAAFADPEDQ
jgi:hypothetical protein